MARSAMAFPIAIVTCVISLLGNGGQSSWVYRGDDGRLRYRTDAHGNRIMDFSHAGYMGGGVPLPVVHAARTIKPLDRDNTGHIQSAIDEVSRLPRDADGFRGAVLLERGTYDVAGQLRISASGVVVRGSGSGEDGSHIRASGPPQRLADIAGEGTWQPVGQPARITDEYVPSGADSLSVDSASAFRDGDTVLVQRPVTGTWIRFMGDRLVRNDKPQIWIKPGTLINQQPPGAKNWCIGCSGRPASILWHGGAIPIPQIPSDTYESPGAAVAPQSLYLAQLQDRLRPAASAQSSARQAVAIVGARMIDGSGARPVDDSVVVVEGDRIRVAGSRRRSRIPRAATVLDAKGKVLMPGLIDAHCHINQEPEDMKRYWVAQLRWGVTTMRSAGNDKPDRVPLFRQTREGALLAPRSYTAGQGFSVSGPYPGAPTFQPTTADEARANVRSLKAQNVDFIKIWMTNPKFPPEVISAIVDEGGKQGIPVIAHVTDVATLRQLADQGVTDFLHTPRDQPVTPELVAYAKSKKLSFAPTLANGESSWFYYEHPEILNMPMLQDALYPRGKQMLADAERRQKTLASPDLAQRKARLREAYPFIKAMSDAGVRIVTGTDCGAEASQVTPFGHATHREVQMYVEAGLSPLAAIRAATLDAARVLTRSEDPDYGVIRAGKAADLLLLDADPTVDINNTIKINKVMRAGRWVQ